MMRAVSEKYSWVNDDRHSLEDFSISSIFPENLKCDESLAQMFVPFRFTHIQHLKDPEKFLGISLKASPEIKEKEEKTENSKKSAFSFSQFASSEKNLKVILKMFKKTVKNISKEEKKQDNYNFKSLTFWHQKCLAAILPFAYCEEKSFSQVSLTRTDTSSTAPGSCWETLHGWPLLWCSWPSWSLRLRRRILTSKRPGDFSAD